MTSVNISTTKNTVTVDEDNPSVITVATLGPQGPAVPDGDKGDITVSNNGTIMTIDAGVVNNAKIASDAAIALSKLATGALPTAITVTSANISDLSIVNADINASAAIAGTKISPDFGSQNIITTGNITIADVTAASLDISGNADIDGTLEADAYTVNGTALNEYIADTIGAMVSGNTETNIAVTYDDSDNTLDFVISSYPAASISGTTLASNVVTSSLTSVGTLGSLNVTNTVTANLFSGSGASLTALNADNISSGTLASARIEDSAITSAKILDGTIVNTDINASAAIAGTKISPDFGSQNIVTTGQIKVDGDGGSKYISVGDNEDFKIYHDAAGPTIFSDANNQGLKIQAKNLNFTEHTGVTTRFRINDDGHVDVAGNLDVGAGVDVTGNITVSGTVDGRDVATDGTKLDTVETNAKDDQTAAEIKTLLNSNGIANAQVDASAAIAGTKISPDFGSQNIVTTGTASIGGGTLYVGTADSSSGHINAYEVMTFNIDTDNDDTNRYFAFYKNGASGSGTELFKLEENGQATITGNLDVTSGVDVTGNITVTGTVDGVDIATRDTLFGGLTSSSGVLTNGVTATTQSASDNSTKVATTAYADTAIANLVDSSPSALNTLNELAAALGDDANFSTTVTNSIATKLPLAGGTLTGALSISDVIKRGTTDSSLQLSGSTASNAGANLLLYGESHSSHANQLRFRQGSTDKFTINGSGNVTFAGNITTNGDNSFNGANYNSWWDKSDSAFKFDDNAKLKVGTGGDLEIYHDSDNSYIVDLGTGSLILAGNRIRLRSSTGEDGIEIYEDGAVELYYDGTKKLETTSSGIDVDGSVTADDIITAGALIHEGDTDTLVHFTNPNEISLKAAGTTRFKVHTSGADITGQLGITGAEGISSSLYLIADEGDDNGDGWRINSNQDDNDLTISNNISGSYVDKLTLQNDGDLFTTGDVYVKNDSKKLKLGASDDLQIYHDGSHSYIKDAGTGFLNLDSNGTFIRSSSGGENCARFFEDGAAELFYDDSKKLETSSAGVKITGELEFLTAGDVNFTGDNYHMVWDASASALELKDNTKLICGTGDDLQIYHDGSHSEIDNNTGNLSLKTQGNLQFFVNDSEDGLYVKQNGAVELYYDNSKKLETGSAGVTVTGNIYTDGNINLTADNKKLRFGAGEDLQIYHDGSHSIIKNSTNSLYAATGAFLVQNAAQTESQIISSENGAVELYYDNAKKLETTSTGATVTGNVNLAADNNSFTVGAGQDLQIYHDGTNNILRNVGTRLDIIVNSSETAAVFNPNTSVDLYYDNSKKFETTSAGATLTGDLLVSAGIKATTNFAGDDNVKLKLGTGDDLQIYHDGSDTFFKVHTTGATYHRARTNWQVSVNATDGGADDAIKAIQNAAVELYYDGSKKFETLSDGLRVSGYIYANDSNRLCLGDSADLQLYHDGSNSNIKNGTGWLNVYAGGNGFSVGNGDFSENLFKAANNAAVELYYDNSKKLETTSAGVDISGGGVNTVKITGTSGHELYSYSDSGGVGWCTGAGAANYGELIYFDENNGNAHIYAEGEQCANFQGNGPVELFYDNSKKLETASNGVQTTGSVIVSGGHVYVQDNYQLKIGGGEDLQIYHDGSNSFVSNTHASSFYIQSNGNLLLEHTNGENYVKGNANGSVELYYDNSKTFQTTSYGAEVIGTFRCDALSLLDNEKIQLGSSGSDLEIYHDGNHNIIKGVQSLLLKKDDADSYIRCTADAPVELYYDNSKKLHTFTGGVKFFGTLEADDNNIIKLGDGADLQLYHDGSNSKIHNDTGHLLIETDATFAIEINKGVSENLAKFIPDGGVELYYDGVKRFHTLNHGAYVTGDFEVFGATANNYVSQFKNGGNDLNRFGINIQCGANDAAGTNTAVRFADGNGDQQGLITFSSGTVSYGAFTAHHPCIVPDSENPSDSSNAYPYGTLLETISIKYTQKNGADTERGIRYKVQKTQSANSRKVLGAYGSSMNGGPDGQTNEHQALVLGDGHILVNNAGGNIEVGDGICSSAVAGIGQKATANPSMVIGIAQEAITFTGSETKLVAVQYGLQQFTPWT